MGRLGRAREAAREDPHISSVESRLDAAVGASTGSYDLIPVINAFKKRGRRLSGLLPM